jgi:hypothetical protein
MLHCFHVCHLSALIFCPDYVMEYNYDQATHTDLDWSSKIFATGELARFNVL